MWYSIEKDKDDMMSNIEVSVIIPAYRCENTICDAIDSALKQNVKLEIIIVDDEGSDDLLNVLKKYHRIPEIHLIRNERNLGAAISRNRGIEHAKGKYIAFLDADDIWKENKLEKQIQRLEETQAVLCSTARELMTSDGKSTGRIIPVKEKITYHELLKHNCINCSSVLMKKEVALEFPMKHAESHEDYILWIEILRKYKEVVAINEPLLKYRLSTTGKSGNKLHSAMMTFQVYRHVGFTFPVSCVLFLSYAFHGIKKYLLSHI